MNVTAVHQSSDQSNVFSNPLFFTCFYVEIDVYSGLSNCADPEKAQYFAW